MSLRKHAVGNVLVCMFDESSRPSSQSSLDYQTAWDTTHPPSVSDRTERAESMNSTLRSFSEHGGDHEEAPRLDEVILEELQIPRVVGSRRSTRTPESVDFNMNRAFDERMEDRRRMEGLEGDHLDIGCRMEIPRVSTRMTRFSESSNRQFEVTRVLESTLMDELRHHEFAHSPIEGTSTDHHEDSVEGRDFFIELPETPMTTSKEQVEHNCSVETRNFAIEVPVTPAASTHTINHHGSVEMRDYLVEYPETPMIDPETFTKQMEHHESVDTRDFHIEVPITPIRTDQAFSGHKLEHQGSVEMRDYLIEFPMSPTNNDRAPSNHVTLKHHESMDTRDYFVEVPETPAFHDQVPSSHTLDRLKFQESVEARDFLIDIPKTPSYDAQASSIHPEERLPQVIEPEDTREVRIEIPKTPNTPKTPSSPYFSDYRDQRELERQVKEREESLKGVVIEMVEERTEDMAF